MSQRGRGQPPPGSARGQSFRGRGQFRGQQPTAGPGAGAGPGQGRGLRQAVAENMDQFGVGQIGGNQPAPAQPAGRGLRQAVMANIGQYGVGQMGQQPPAAGGGPPGSPPRPPTAGRGRAGPGQGAVGGQQEQWMFIPGYRYPAGTRLYYPTPGTRTLQNANYWDGHRPRHPQGLGPRPPIEEEDQMTSGWEHDTPPHMNVPEGVRLPDEWYLFWPWVNWHNGWQWDYSRMAEMRPVNSVRGWQF